MERLCEACGKPMAVQRSTKRYCSSSCRARAAGGQVVALERPAEQTTDGPVTAQVRAELEAAGRSDSWLAASALMLAARLDSGQEPGTAVKGLNAELRATMAEALRGAVRSSVASMRDELAERRRRA